MATLAVGTALREERLRQGLAIRDISNQTRISSRFLEAIEKEAFEELPGILFTRNFVRQYASFLKLDPAPLLESLPRVDVETVPLPDPAQFTGSVSPRSSSALSTVLWIVMAAGVSVGAWVYFERPRAIFERSPAPQLSAQQAPAPVAPSAPTAKTPETPLAQPSDSAAPASTSPLDATGTPAAAPDLTGRAVQVVLKAKEASWVQIVADGKNAFTGILKPNDSREVGADALVKVTAGNAGGIEISLNGKSLDPLGTSGQVRTVRLTAEGLQPAIKAPAPDPL